MEKFTVFSDIEGYKTEHGGTFPSYLTVTTDRPDMVSIDKTQKRVLICELTVPFESNIIARHTFTYTPVVKHYLKKHSIRTFQQSTLPVQSTFSIAEKNQPGMNSHLCVHLYTDYPH